MLRRRYFYVQTLRLRETETFQSASLPFKLHQGKICASPLLDTSFFFPSTIVISPLLAGPLTAKVLMHTLPRSVILKASAQVLCCWHFVNLSPRQRQLEQSGCSGVMER